jgi:hypothetical protein
MPANEAEHFPISMKPENALAPIASQDRNPAVSISAADWIVRLQAGSGGATGGTGLGLGAAAFRTTFLALAFFAGALRAAAFLATAFLATAFLAGAFLAALFFAGAFFAGAFLAGAFFAGAFLAGDFLAALFFVAVFLVAVFAAVFFAGVFFVAALTMLELPSDNRQSVHMPTRGSKRVALFMRRARGIACSASLIVCKQGGGHALASAAASFANTRTTDRNALDRGARLRPSETSDRESKRL